MHRDTGHGLGAPNAGLVGAPEANSSPSYTGRLVRDSQVEMTLAHAGLLDSVCDCACFAVQGEAVPVLSRPVSFYLELTPRCNNACPACANAFVAGTPRQNSPAPGLRSEPPLSTAAWGQVIESLHPHAHAFKLTGGEPTLHPGFITILEHVVSTDIPFTIFSNGRWREPRRMLDLLVAAPGMQGLLISLHGHTPAAHEAFTATPGSFDEALVGVRLATRKGIPVTLSCVVTARNWTAIDQMAALARHLGASGVVFNRFLGSPNQKLSPTPSQLAAAITRIETLRATGARVKLGNCVPACFVRTSQPGCLAGLALLTIDPWGRARPCNHVPDLVGNLLEQPVGEIWQGPQMKAWRDSRSTACAECALVDTCRGGCRALATGDPLRRDPLQTAPLSADTTHPQDVSLYAGARPLARFSRRTEAFGPVLLRGSQLYVGTHDDEPVLDLFDGQKTVSEIEACCGQRGLDLVASLYHYGLIELL